MRWCPLNWISPIRPTRAVSTSHQCPRVDYDRQERTLDGKKNDNFPPKSENEPEWRGGFFRHDEILMAICTCPDNKWLFASRLRFRPGNGCTWSPFENVMHDKGGKFGVCFQLVHKKTSVLISDVYCGRVRVKNESALFILWLFLIFCFSSLLIDHNLITGASHLLPNQSHPPHHRPYEHMNKRMWR